MICLILNLVLGGRFLADTVFANLNPFAFWKLEAHARYAALAVGQLIIVAAAGMRSALAGPGRALFIYLGLSATELVLVAPKIGSDSNYQIETSVLLALCACMSLHALNFFTLTFNGSKTWITLLQLPLAVHCLLNVRITVPILIGRVYTEKQFRAQTIALQPYLADGGRVISTDIGAMVHLGRRLKVEPLIYSLLVTAGRSDPHPLRRDIAAEAFSTILLYENVNVHEIDLNPEVPTLPSPQLDQVKAHYKLVDRIPGPYVGGIYVYKRLSWVAPL